MEEFKRQLKSLTIKLKEAETRAENAEKNVKKLQKEVDRLEGTCESLRDPLYLIHHQQPYPNHTICACTIALVVVVVVPSGAHTKRVIRIGNG